MRVANFILLLLFFIILSGSTSAMRFIKIPNLGKKTLAGVIGSAVLGTAGGVGSGFIGAGIGKCIPFKTSESEEILIKSFAGIGGATGFCLAATAVFESPIGIPIVLGIFTSGELARRHLKEVSEKKYWRERNIKRYGKKCAEEIEKKETKQSGGADD